MRLYPSRPAPTIARDVAVLLLLLAFAWAGVRVHHAVAELAGLGRGLQGSGRALASTARDATGAVQDGFGTAAAAVADVPLVGGRIASGLRDAGRAATGEVQRRADTEAARLVAAGREGERRANRLATLLGWLTFVVPAVLLLARAIPARVRQVRRLTVTARLLSEAPDDVLARRAAYNLPYAVLARHTRDPFGDLAAGRYGGLLAALADDAGTPVPAAPRSRSPRSG